MFDDWVEPVDYRGEIIEHVYQPCFRHAANVVAATEGVDLTDEQKDRFVSEHLFPTMKIVVDNSVATLNDIFNDPIAQNEMGYQHLQIRQESYQEFLFSCLAGAGQYYTQ